jgi:HK97 family phage major capsid protein
VTTCTPTPEYLERLERRRDALRQQATDFLMERRAQGVEELSGPGATKFRGLQQALSEMDDHVSLYESELRRIGTLPAGLGGGGGGVGSDTYTRNWARQTLRSMKQALGGSEERAVISGSVDVPVLIEPEVVATPFKKRLIDAYGQKRTTPSTAIEYFQQTARTNNAAPVPDLAQKPTTILTVTPVVDRCRVVATLSENLPLRIWTDEQAIISWLTTQLAGSVIDEIEQQTISGDGTGENFRGIINTPGVNSVAFDTDPSTTLRHAITKLQNLGETPTGWALNPEDAEALDLERWGASGGFLHGGYENGAAVGTSDNILGAGVQRIISPNVPVGLGVVADWTQLALYYRESMRIDVDGSGPLFDINAVRFRAESRCVSAVLRPQAFAVCELSATTKSSSSKE